MKEYNYFHCFGRTRRLTVRLFALFCGGSIRKLT